MYSPPNSWWDVSRNSIWTKFSLIPLWWLCWNTSHLAKGTKARKNLRLRYYIASSPADLVTPPKSNPTNQHISLFCFLTLIYFASFRACFIIYYRVRCDPQATTVVAFHPLPMASADVALLLHPCLIIALSRRPKIRVHEKIEGDRSKYSCSSWNINLCFFLSLMQEFSPLMAVMQNVICFTLISFELYK